MSKERLLRVILFLVITSLRPLAYILKAGHVNNPGPKDFVYDID